MMGFAERFQHRAAADGVTHTGDREALRQSAELIAELMDTAIRVPGTNIRIGLDPLIGLLPGVGDAVAGAIGSIMLLLAHRAGVPRIVQVRMATNVLLNALVGAVPGLGDLFSVWFRSNLRNAHLLRRHATSSRQSTASDWAFVLGLIAVVLVAMGLALTAVVWLLRSISEGL